MNSSENPTPYNETGSRESKLVGNHRARWSPWWLLLILGIPLVMMVCRCVSNSDPVGGPGLSCDNWDLDPVKSGSGWIVTGHTTACTTFGTDIATYVFVHKEGDVDNRSNMVLRYFQSFETKGPFISWKGPNEVAIEIEAPDAITKSLNQIESVRVSLTVRP